MKNPCHTKLLKSGTNNRNWFNRVLNIFRFKKKPTDDESEIVTFHVGGFRLAERFRKDISQEPEIEEESNSGDY